MSAVALPLLALVAAGLWFRLPGATHSGPLPPLTASQSARAAELAADVNRLAGELGERHVWNPEARAHLSAAWEWIDRAFERAGYPQRRREPVPTGTPHPAWNLWVELPGREPGAGLVVVGAHYDSALETPGADDNASGVAALLAVRLVAFVNEEPPFFGTERMGSRVHARGCTERGERVVAMLSLECLGRFSDEPGSQRYPDGVGWLFPDRGDFVGFVGDLSSRALLRRAVGAFREGVDFPSVGAALPAGIPGVGWSDHASFWAEGVPALMVTDTALFRDEQYHRPGDLPERLDYERLSRVVDGLDAVLDELLDG